MKYAWKWWSPDMLAFLPRTLVDSLILGLLTTQQNSLQQRIQGPGQPIAKETQSSWLTCGRLPGEGQLCLWKKWEATPRLIRQVGVGCVFKQLTLTSRTARYFQSHYLSLVYINLKHIWVITTKIVLSETVIKNEGKALRHGLYNWFRRNTLFIYT